MSAPVAVEAPPLRRPLSTTEKNWLWALVVTVAIVLLFRSVRNLEESEGIARPDRFVWQASETSTRFLAIAHTLVATTFLLSSRRMRRPAGWAWFSSLTVAGVGACLGYWALGGKHHALSDFLFYAYFLGHEIRDELFFYRANGDAPDDEEAAPSARALWTAPLVLAAALGAVFLAAGAWGIGGARRYAMAFEGVAPWLRGAAGVAALLGAAALLVVVKRRWDRLHPGGWREVIRVHRPVLLVFAATYGVLLAGIALTGRMYAIVAIHVVVWYVFTIRRLVAAPPRADRPRPFTWAWVRTTPAGFNAFHLGLLALVVGAAAVRALAYSNGAEPAWLAVAVSKESFPYWTLMHVTWSWVPRG